MKLSVLQIIALKSIPGCGNGSILKLQSYASYRDQNPEIAFDDAVASDECSALWQLLQQFHAQKQGAHLIQCTRDVLKDAIERARRLVVSSGEQGVFPVCFNDNGFPDNLRNRKPMNGRGTMPVLMWYKGNLSVLSKHKTAVIGTRFPSESGYRRGEEMGFRLASSDIAVVSGLATGCDTAGHRGALRAGGATVALLGHGLDSIYPSENACLAEEIVRAGGLLMSEDCLGTTVSRRGLIERSCLQAMVSDDVVVVECSEKSGTFYAANGALALGKKLFVASYTVRQGGERAGNVLLSKKGAAWVGEDTDWTSVLKESNTK